MSKSFKLYRERFVELLLDTAGVLETPRKAVITHFETNSAAWYKYIRKLFGTAQNDPRFYAKMEDQLLDFCLDKLHGDNVMVYVLSTCPVLSDYVHKPVLKEAVKEEPKGGGSVTPNEEYAKRVKDLITFLPVGVSTMTRYGDIFSYFFNGYMSFDVPRLLSLYQGRNELKNLSVRPSEARYLNKFMLRCYDIYHAAMYGDVGPPMKKDHRVYDSPNDSYILVPCCRMGSPLMPYYRMVKKIKEIGDDTQFLTPTGPRQVMTKYVVSINEIFNANKVYPFVGRPWNNLIGVFDQLFAKYVDQGYWFTSWVSFIDSRTQKDVVFLAF